MARYLQNTVYLGTVFPKKVLGAFGMQKSMFTDGKATFLRPEGLQNIFWKNCPKVNCGLQISSHCKKKRKISNTLGEDTFCVFYFRIFNVIFPWPVLPTLTVVVITRYVTKNQFVYLSITCLLFSCLFTFKLFVYFLYHRTVIILSLDSDDWITGQWWMDHWTVMENMLLFVFCSAVVVLLGAGSKIVNSDCILFPATINIK